jgi:putative hydrolase of the HAD superfamily
MTRAAIFDLDDTLYPRVRFLQSGFAAVARYLSRTHALDAPAVYRALWRAYGTARGHEFQALSAEYGLSAATVPALVEVLRAHVPTLWPSHGAVETLTRLRAHGWRLAILTNGPPAVQAAKVRALGLAPLVDDVVYAEAVTPGGKPGSAAFEEALWRLQVPAARAVCVGDDPVRDVLGARRTGLHTIRITTLVPPCPPGEDADIVVGALADVPAAAATLVEGTMAHVA